MPHKNTLGYWTRAEDWASWEFVVSKPGTFTVTALQGCGTGQGGSVVEFRVADQALTLTVEDTGRGISADELDGIFQPFHGSFEKGTGLGLAIVHRIVTDYSGSIEVSSTPGQGTAMRVHLPVSAAAPVLAHARPSAGGNVA